jgi:hypothetical protein
VVRGPYDIIDAGHRSFYAGQSVVACDGQARGGRKNNPCGWVYDDISRVPPAGANLHQPEGSKDAGG